MSSSIDGIMEIWEQLFNQGGEAPGYNLRPLVRKGETSLFAAYNAANRSKGLIIQMPSELKPSGIAQQGSRKIEFVDRFSGLRQGMSAVGLFLKDEGYIDLFSILVASIVDEIERSSSGIEACTVALKSLTRWRLFLEKRGVALSESEVRGLIGELSILKRLVRKFGSTEAIRSWRGPYVEIRDFELPDYSVEVKTCVPSEGATITINRPEQLDAQDKRPVYLGVVTLAKSQSEGLSIDGHIAAVLEELNDSADVVHFWDALASAGYLQGQSGLYRDCFAISSVETYLVSDGFPRLASSQIPAGVMKVKFDVAVSALTQYVVDSGSVIGLER